jgi:diguanylate cyclase (GGDEF)-like protein
MIGATLLLTLANAGLRHQLRLRAITDELTGTMTRRALRELAPALIEQHHGQQHEVAVLMLDLDAFKVVNDNHGHAVGDAVLRLAARALQAHTRVDTLLARYGGEEFVVVVPVDDLPAARRVAERLRQSVEAVPWPSELGLRSGVTVSVGLAMIGAGECLDAALKRADEALYRAKHEGRNQCQVALERA